MKSRRTYTKLLKVLPLGKRINSEGKAQKLNFTFSIYIIANFYIHLVIC